MFHNDHTHTPHTLSLSITLKFSHETARIWKSNRSLFLHPPLLKFSEIWNVQAEQLTRDSFSDKAPFPKVGVSLMQVLREFSVSLGSRLLSDLMYTHCIPLRRFFYASAGKAIYWNWALAKPLAFCSAMPDTMSKLTIFWSERRYRFLQVSGYLIDSYLLIG